VFLQTREELVAQFDAVTVAPQTQIGVWIHEGQRFEDESVRFIVDVADSEETLYFFVNFKTKLLERFQQIDIYVASYPVDII
jgi:hypothetical protein